MKFLVGLLTLFYLWAGQLRGQFIFSYGDETLTLIDTLRITEARWHDEPIHIGDHPWQKVFKGYFNPSGFENFKSFFTSQDWPGFTEETYNTWQESLKEQKLILLNVMLIKDRQDREYLLFQYTMETEQYSIFQSKVMKRVHGMWKHRNLEEGTLTLALEQLGRMEPNVLYQKVRDGKATLRLDQLEGTQIRTYEEKFDRNALFLLFQPELLSMGILADDIAHARQLFLAGDQKAMIEHLSTVYQIEDVTLMKSVNARCGFALFNFLSSTGSK